MTLIGTVTISTGAWYEVLTDEGRQLKCRIRGKLRLRGVRTTNPIAVGDKVVCEEQPDGEYVITDICPRRNYIIRRASNLSKESHIIGANIDLALLVVSVARPSTPYEFIDRFLVTCEAYGVPVRIILNKHDIASETPDLLEQLYGTYAMAGYKVTEVSATEGTGIEKLRRMTIGKTVLLAGNSGVGKSSIINALEPDAKSRTAEISEAHLTGMHTTTFSQMYPLTGGGFIIDTPGIKGFGLIDIEPTELAHYFPDFMKFAPECGFYNCTHTHEPRCAIREAVEGGQIPYSRYESYLKILEEDNKYRQ